LRHEADYRREWVTISGLHFLDEGSHTIGSGAGSAIVIDAPLPARVTGAAAEAQPRELVQLHPSVIPAAASTLDDPDLRPDRWTIRTVGKRLAEVGDPLRDLVGMQQSLPDL